MLRKYFYGAGENADIRSFPNGSNKYCLHSESFYQEIKGNKETSSRNRSWVSAFRPNGFVSFT
jgi:hypothetical protein